MSQHFDDMHDHAEITKAKAEGIKALNDIHKALSHHINTHRSLKKLYQDVARERI